MSRVAWANIPNSISSLGNIKECKQMYIFITKKGTFYCTQIKTGMKQNIKNILDMENNP